MNTILIVLTIFFGGMFLVLLKRKEYTNKIILLSRLFIAVVFLYSGFVKAVDPLGYTYKIVDYFVAFGFPPMDSFSFVLAILFSSAEFLLGFGMLIGIYLRVNTYLVALFMLVFTPLTLYLAISNPVTDCGCFGDALVITNWQTFWKNLIIDIPVLILLIRKSEVKNSFRGISSAIISIITLSGIIYVSIFSYQHLPILDFRPFKIGANIRESMQMPDNAKQDIYETTFIYKNLENGEVVEFAEDNLEEAINNEKKWEFVDSESILLEEGYHPPIHDFSIVSNRAGDITEQVLNDTNYTLILIAYDLKKSNIEAINRFENLSLELSQTTIKTLALTAALDDEISEIKERVLGDVYVEGKPKKESQSQTIYFYEYEGNILEFTEEDLPSELDDSYILVGTEEVEKQQGVEAKLAFDFYICDPTTLKTIVRANPGLVLIQKGTVVQKWHYNDFPTKQELIELSERKLNK